jgi:hypothetical protein
MTHSQEKTPAIPENLVEMSTYFGRYIAQTKGVVHFITCDKGVGLEHYLSNGINALNDRTPETFVTYVPNHHCALELVEGDTRLIAHARPSPDAHVVTHYQDIECLNKHTFGVLIDEIYEHVANKRDGIIVISALEQDDIMKRISRLSQLVADAIETHRLN